MKEYNSVNYFFKKAVRNARKKVQLMDQMQDKAKYGMVLIYWLGEQKEKFHEQLWFWQEPVTLNLRARWFKQWGPVIGTADNET